MSNEHEPDGPIPHNVFEANAFRNMGEQTVPLKFGGRVVGEATVVYDPVGIRVVSTEITDPDLTEMLTNFDIGIGHIINHDEREGGVNE